VGRALVAPSRVVWVGYARRSVRGSGLAATRFMSPAAPAPDHTDNAWLRFAPSANVVLTKDSEPGNTSAPQAPESPFRQAGPRADSPVPLRSNRSHRGEGRSRTSPAPEQIRCATAE
jgi:hypothetical protein